MLVVDTSVWIEYLKGREPYSSTMKQLMAAGQVIAISPVWGELMQGARGAREIGILDGFWSALPKVDETHLMLEAGRLSHELGLLQRGVGLIDAAILKTVLSAKARLWTLDACLLEVCEPALRYG